MSLSYDGEITYGESTEAGPDANSNFFVFDVHTELDTVFFPNDSQFTHEQTAQMIDSALLDPSSILQLGEFSLGLASAAESDGVDTSTPATSTLHEQLKPPDATASSSNSQHHVLKSFKEEESGGEGANGVYTATCAKCREVTRRKRFWNSPACVSGECKHIIGR